MPLGRDVVWTQLCDLVEQQRFLDGQRQAEAALAEAKARYGELCETSSDIIFSCDLRQHITSLNRAGEALTGYAHDEAQRLCLLDIVVAEHRERAQEMLRATLAGEAGRPYELDILTREGLRLTVEVRACRLWEGGELVGIQGIAHDVTERRQLEARLRQAEKLETIGRVAGGVAHDFGNLLTVINACSQLILEDLDKDSPGYEDAERIFRAGQRAAELTRQLLVYSRRDSRGVGPVCINALCTALADVLPRILTEDVSLQLRLTDGPTRVCADEGDLELALINLAVNANDAMSSGGVLALETDGVAVSEGPEAEAIGVAPGDYVRIVVRDTGCGMTEEVQARIFEPFFTTKAPGKGTGLGLPSVLATVKALGGGITVESELGRGTTFRIYLPSARDGCPEDRRTTSSTAASQGGRTVLVVEDQESVRKVIARMLAHLGHFPIEAASGQEAIEVARCLTGLDGLVTDVVMPGMDGPRLTTRIRELFPGIGCLFVTGHPEEELARRGALDAGVRTLCKPFSLEQLSGALQMALGGQR